MNMTNTKLESEITWTLVSEKPIVLYLPKHDDYLVVWAGVPMIYEDALALTFADWTGLHPTSKATNRIIRKIHKALKSGMLAEEHICAGTLFDLKHLEKEEDLEIDHDLRTVYNNHSTQLRLQLSKTFIKLREDGKTLQDVMSYLSLSNASVKD